MGDRLAVARAIPLLLLKRVEYEQNFSSAIGAIKHVYERLVPAVEPRPVGMPQDAVGIEMSARCPICEVIGSEWVDTWAFLWGCSFA